MPPPTTAEIGTLLQEVNTRLQSLPVALGEAEIRAIVQNVLKDLANDPASPIAGRLRFGGSEADARLLGSKFGRWGLGVADVEFLYDLQSGLRGAPKRGGGVYTGPSEELENTFKAISSAIYIPDEEIRRMDRQAMDELYPRVPRAMLRQFDAAVKAMDSAESGFGSQLVGAQYVGELWEGQRRESRIMGLLDMFEMTAPSVYMPVEVDIPEMLYVSESTANNSANYATVKTGSNRVLVTAAKFVIHQMWSGELEEDSILPFVPFIRRQATLAVAHYTDSVVLNGDTTNAATGNINLDDADPADTKHYLAMDGIRHAALVDNTANAVDMAGALTWAGLAGLPALMIDSARLVDWGHPTSPDDLIYIADPVTADKAQLLTEVLTVDKYGPGATVLTGELARGPGRHPLLASMAMPRTEADGKVSTTGSNNTKGQVALLNRRGFKVGWRRRVRVEVERIPATDQSRIVYSLRFGLGRFTPTAAASGIEAVTVLYNIT